MIPSLYIHRASKIYSFLQHTNAEWVEAEEIFPKNSHRACLIWGIIRVDISLFPIQETTGGDMIRAVLFDFGGVLAEEGFREGLKAIAKGKGLNQGDFYEISSDLVYQTGYITGGCNEHSYWNVVRQKTGVKGTDQEFREEILKRFKLRPKMTAVVDKMKSSGLIVAILSDQTNWLDELDRRTPFHHRF